MGMFIRQTWNDSRLIYDTLTDLPLLELDNALMSKVWVPDLFFPSEKKASVHSVTVPNKLMHIYPKGRIQYSQRYIFYFSQLCRPLELRAGGRLRLDSTVPSFPLP